MNYDFAVINTGMNKDQINYLKDKNNLLKDANGMLMFQVLKY